MTILFTASLLVGASVYTAFSFRHLLIIAGLFLSLSPAHLTAQKLDWVQQASGTGFQEMRSMAVDADQNVFVIGTYEGMTDFDSGSGNLDDAGFFDVFFAKYDASGNLVWAKQVGGTGVDSGYGIALDANGNIYIAGNFNGTTDFDPGPGKENLTSIGGFDAFLAKYDAVGNLLWANNMGGTLFEEARCIALDDAGNVVIAGIFSGTADFDPGPGNSNFQAEGSNDIFFAKYNPSGDLLYAKQMNGDGAERILAIAMGHSNDLYIAGHFQGTVDFDPSDGTFERSAVGDSDLFFARYDDAGNLVWAKSAGSLFYEEVRGIAVDRFDHIYLVGRYGETFDIDPGPGVSVLENAGINDAFFAKYDASGHLIWAKGIHGKDNDFGNAIAVDTLGRVYLTGHFINTVDFDPSDDTSNLTGAGDMDIFLAQYDASGHFIWAKNIGGLQMEESTAITLDAQQNLYVAGFFKGTADFDPGPNATPLVSVGGNDAFIGKYSPITTAMHDVSLLNARIYPVPAASTLHIALPDHTGKTVVAIFDQIGRIVLEQQGEGDSLTVDLSRLSSGVYYLSIKSEQGMKGLAFEVAR